MKNYQSVPLTPIIMKCFECLIMVSINDTISINSDPHQYAYKNLMQFHPWTT